jgi:hypothetical protein
MNQKLIEDLDRLHTSENEEQITEYIKKILKGYNTITYKHIIMSNPYFKSLINDIKSDIIDEIEHMKNMLSIEIENLNKELSNTTSKEEFTKYKNLRRECVFMLNELDNRQKDLYLLN